MGDKRRAAAPRTTLAAKLALMAGSVLLLLLLLALVELVMGWAGYGPPRRLFVKRDLGGEQIYQLNREISELFFPDWATKPPAYQHFPAQKAPGAYRVMAMGASSTLGDPFGPQTAFPALMGGMLTDAAPGRRFEVVNCAVIAISSLDVLLLHREALRYEPDAVLLYTGHNEAYGADGIDTPVQRSFTSRDAARFWLWFRNLRLVRLARSTLGRLSAPEPGQGPAAEGFGMWLMRDRIVPACGEKHARMLEFYRANLTDMLADARNSGVDVILCTLLSNLRDQSPLGAVHGCDFDPAAEDRWRAELDRGARAMAEAAWPAALEALEACRALDPEHAETRFRLGRCHDALGDSAAALAEYRAACDLDAVHFRACSAQNEIVRELARTWETRGRHRLVLVDLDRRLHEQFPHGAGAVFFTEHVHPYPVGHAWIAREIVRALAEAGLVEACDPSRLGPLESYVARTGMSDLDLAAGLYLTDLHKLAKWPFIHCFENDRARAAVQARIGELALRLGPEEQTVFQAIPTDRTGDLYDFGKRHYYLFTQHRAQRRGPEALRELLIARSYWWPEAFLEVDLAQVLVGLHQPDQAEQHLMRARALDPDYAPIHFVAGALHHARGATDTAREEFQAYLRAEPQGAYAAAAARALQVLGTSPQ